MIVSRRKLIGMGGGFVAALSLPSSLARAEAAVEIGMIGTADGADVGFDPVGVHIDPGQTVRWVNRNAGNSHTATAYHPDYFGRSRRIPLEALPWNSDYLLPDESFSFTFSGEGVYDYYCIPHEQAGMVGRIVVGDRRSSDFSKDADRGLPEVALARFPSVEEILEHGNVRRSLSR